MDTEKIKQLQKMFEPQDIEWRIQQCGVTNGNPWAMVIPYITSRAVQSRLDDVFGLEWENVFKEVNGGMLCGIRYPVGNGEFRTRWDGAPVNPQHPVKGVVSDATKRAAVQLGIGRYLYQLDSVFAECQLVNNRREATANYHLHKVKVQGSQDQKYHMNWFTPDLPSWAIPHEDISPFINAMKESQTLADLQEAFKNAYLFSKSNNDNSMEQQFVDCKDSNKQRIIDNLKKISEKQFSEIQPFIDKQSKLFSQLPTKATLDNNFELAKKQLEKECEGKTFDPKQALELLDKAYKDSLNKLTAKTKKQG